MGSVTCIIVGLMLSELLYFIKACDESDDMKREGAGHPLTTSNYET
jgi:hypothetical protein